MELRLIQNSKQQRELESPVLLNIFSFILQLDVKLIKNVIRYEDASLFVIH